MIRSFPKTVALSSIQTPAPSVVALGCFDGIHTGHRRIIEKTVRIASLKGISPVVFTFDAPPAEYLSGVSTPILSDEEERLDIFRSYGISSVNIAYFPDLREISAEDFIKEYLIGICRAEAVVFGFNFTFGKGRKGDPETLRTYFGANAVCVPAVTYLGEPVSSSRIRRLLSEGNVSEAAEMLERPYSMTLPVIKGRHDGTSLGFPTLNQIPPANRAVPCDSVYITAAELPDGRRVPAVSDVGTAPTLDRTGIRRIETHLLEGGCDLYGQNVKIEFLKRLRGEMKFPDRESLVRQITADARTAIDYFSK